MSLVVLEIIDTTDKKFIGDTIETDLMSATLPSGDHIEFHNRLKDLDGTWKLWNTNYVIIAKEV